MHPFHFTLIERHRVGGGVGGGPSIDRSLFQAVNMFIPSHSGPAKTATYRTEGREEKEKKNHYSRFQSSNPSSSSSSSSTRRNNHFTAIRVGLAGAPRGETVLHGKEEEEARIKSNFAVGRDVSLDLQSAGICP